MRSRLMWPLGRPVVPVSVILTQSDAHDVWTRFALRDTIMIILIIQLEVEKKWPAWAQDRPR